MTTPTFARLAAAGVAVCALSTAPLSAATLASAPSTVAPASSTATYVVRTVMSGPNGSMTADELLNIASSNGTAAVTLVQRGTNNSARLLAPINADGVLGVASADPAIACYNTAQGIAAGSTAAPAQTAIALSFGGNQFAVPLRMASVSAQGGQDITVGGRVDGAFDAQPQTTLALVVQGALHVRQQQLSSLDILETTVMTNTNAPIAQTSCQLLRVNVDAPAVPV